MLKNDNSQNTETSINVGDTTMIPSAMSAAQYSSFCGPIEIRTVPTPTLDEKNINHSDSILLKVLATGVCRSDWHGWKGHDSDIKDHGLPFTPGHECSGIIVQIGSNVKKCQIGQSVVVPFILSCGTCRECHCGKPTVCENQAQPGFTIQGSFAEYVRIPRADRNVCVLPQQVDFVEAAALGCRFTTAYRAVVQQGEWGSSSSNGYFMIDNCMTCAIFGCGGLGLSCIMIAKAVMVEKQRNMIKSQNPLTYQIIAIDVSTKALRKAKEVGATHLINASNYAVSIQSKNKKYNNSNDYVRDTLFQITNKKGADLSIDAAGFVSTCENAVYCTRRGGKMIQVGLPINPHSRPPIIPMGMIAGKEIEIIGSHGCAAHDIPNILNMVATGVLQPKKLVGKEVSLFEGAKAIQDMDKGSPIGITMITRFNDFGQNLSKNSRL